MSLCQELPLTNFSFQQLYGGLEASLKLNKKAQLKISREYCGRSERTRNSASIAHTGQGRYKNREILSPNGDDNENPGPLSIAGCFNCDDPSHMGKDCPKPRNFAGAAARKLEYLQKKKTFN